MRRIRAIVSGRVQGVAYRASTAAKARQLGLAGWVKNLANGNVELEAEGSPDQVAALVTWCHHGPPSARVDQVAVEELAPMGGDDFDVRY
jgi:acylphosphatase